MFGLSAACACDKQTTNAQITTTGTVGFRVFIISSPFSKYIEAPLEVTRSWFDRADTEGDLDIDKPAALPAAAPFYCSGMLGTGNDSVATNVLPSSVDRAPVSQK